eukprot:6177115-Pleurochrysis_carterae.AAC.4
MLTSWHGIQIQSVRRANPRPHGQPISIHGQPVDGRQYQLVCSVTSSICTVNAKPSPCRLLQKFVGGIKTAAAVAFSTADHNHADRQISSPRPPKTDTRECDVFSGTSLPRKSTAPAASRRLRATPAKRAAAEPRTLAHQ